MERVRTDYKYVYGLDLISATDGSGNQTYFTYDGLGSTTDLTDGAAIVTGSYSYDVFGAVGSQCGWAEDWIDKQLVEIIGDALADLIRCGQHPVERNACSTNDYEGGISLVENCHKAICASYCPHWRLATLVSRYQFDGEVTWSLREVGGTQDIVSVTTTFDKMRHAGGVTLTAD